MSFMMEDPTLRDREACVAIELHVFLRRDLQPFGVYSSPINEKVHVTPHFIRIVAAAKQY